MKLDFSHIPDGVLPPDPEPGNLYRNQKGAFLLIVGIRGGSAYYVRYDCRGEADGAGSYGTSYFREQRAIGRVDLPCLTVEWVGP